MRNKLLFAGVTALAFGAGHPSATLAQSTATNGDASAQSDELQEVIVTAERRTQDLQKTAIAITVVSGESLEAHGENTPAQILQDVPSVVVQGGIASPIGGAGGPPNIAIRGIGTDGPNRNGATAIYEDGVLIVGGGADFYDVNRIEVLRGPQGTLYGRGATGGAVNIITNDPNQNFGGSGQANIGSYGTFDTQGALNLPVTDTLSARFSFNTVHHNGYFSSTAGNESDYSGRAKILFRPNDNFSLLLGGVHYAADQNGGGTVTVSNTNPTPTDWTASTTVAGHDVISFTEGYANLELNLGFANLTYIPAYQVTSSTQNNFDGSISGMPWNHQFTQELRLSNDASSKLTWTAGAFYYNSNFYQNYGIPGTFHFDQGYAASSAAAFGELTVPVTDATRLSGGVRESRDTVYHTNTSSFPRGNPATNPLFVSAYEDVLNKSYSHFDWKARAEHDLTPDNMLYGVISTGYRPGGSVNGLAYAPEVVTAYEVGAKNRFGDRAVVNGALFYYNYGGFQAPESCCAPQVQSVMESLPAKFFGAEVEGTLLLTAADQLQLSGTYLHARFEGDTTASTLFAKAYADGQAVPHAPTWSMAGTFSHTFTLPNGAKLVPEIDSHYQTQIFTDFDTSVYGQGGTVTDQSFVQKAYTIANATLTYTSTSGNYHITIYDNNLTNVIYKTTVTSGPAGNTAGVNDPRTFGLIVGVKF